MTEEQIIKALECCIGGKTCINCPLKTDDACFQTVRVEALGIINRQNLTIDELTKAYRSLKSEKNAEIEQKDVVIKGLEKALENVTIEADRLLKECESKEKAYTDEYILRKELKAENERLKSDNDILSKNMHNLCKELDAEKLKNF